MTEAEKRRRRCCIAGHTPAELKRPEEDVRVDLENAILRAVDRGYSTFVSGLTCGVEIWAAEIVIRLKDRFPELHLVAVIPCPGFDAEWPEEWRVRYNRLLCLAEYVKVIGEASTPETLRARNEWMVGHSSMVIAVYGGFSGETRELLRCAMQCRLPVTRLPA